MSILHCTITNNRADSDGDGVGSGGGIHVGSSTTTVTIDHSIVAGNFRGAGSTRDDIKRNVGVGAIAVTWSLIGDDTGANITDNGGNQIGTGATPIDPYLLPLADNGGSTMTHALQAFSSARNMGNPSGVPGVGGVPEFDQRGAGFPRKVASRIDIGAYEIGVDEVCVMVSTLSDELDTNLSFGDLSLREAVNYANTAGEPMTICLPVGEYGLTHLAGDLDITGNVSIVGDGPGLSVIDGGSSSYGRILDVANAAVLNLSRVTLAVGHGTHNSDQRSGGAVRVQNGGQLHMDNSAVVGNETGGWGLGGGIYFASTASGSIDSSVITVNYADQQTGGLYLANASGTGGTVTLKNTIIANNWDGEGTEYPDIYVGANRTLTSLGGNRFTSADGFTMHATDYMGSVDYVVTSVADTYDGSSDPVNMSLRDAIDLANKTAGSQEIWLPAWTFVLTIDRGSNATDTSVAYGDLDIGKSAATDPGGSLTIRGINGLTSVAWAPGLPSDKVFELLGDYNNDGVVNAADGVVLSKNLAAADGDDDGNYVNDLGDQNIYSWNFNALLVLDGVS